MRGKPSRSGWTGSSLLMLVQEYFVAADSDLRRLMESQTGRLMGSRWRSPQVALAATVILKIYKPALCAKNGRIAASFLESTGWTVCTGAGSIICSRELRNGPIWGDDQLMLLYRLAVHPGTSLTARAHTKVDRRPAGGKMAAKSSMS
ncbi:hypothetical protein MGU_09356 [Metarhizium guizhouense ARSEF 977]|uniref:Uncharacterized protein n=1 Tax=Metarhizium guizhouense (strain ARSEF 977) TaxID=1276136 RepID=A0A0B4GL99_METGA|nr:hypothetical protein MGU_09356 [Metarhizium guizhouense ARSEF 977]